MANKRLESAKNQFPWLLERVPLSEAANEADSAQQQAFDSLEAKLETEDAFKRLTDIQRDVVRMKHGIGAAHPFSFVEIADYFGFSVSSAKRHYNAGLKNLRKFFKVNVR